MPSKQLEALCEYFTMTIFGTNIWALYQQKGSILYKNCRLGQATGFLFTPCENPSNYYSEIWSFKLRTRFWRGWSIGASRCRQWRSVPHMTSSSLTNCFIHEIALGLFSMGKASYFAKLVAASTPSIAMVLWLRHCHCGVKYGKVSTLV